MRTRPTSYDVIVIGAGGAGLRAAIEATRARARRSALVCKSLLGKAHTVMAEGGMAAAMGNVWTEDNWQVHFRGHHARRQAPQQLADGRAARPGVARRACSSWRSGARSSTAPRTASSPQRDFGGHRYARLAHVGDRTGLELIRTLQQRVRRARHRRLHGVQPPAPDQDGDRVARRGGLLARHR